LTLRVGDDQMIFNINPAMKRKHEEVESCLRVDIINEIVQEHFRKSYPQDPLENCLVHGGSIDDDNHNIAAFAQHLESFPPHPEATIFQLEKVQNLEIKPPSLKIEDAPKVDLKPLPSNLRYAFLGPNGTYPVIINASLTDIENRKI